MSTRYYYMGNKEICIGSRAAAGTFCYRCGISLCKQGEDAVHNASATFHDTCPKCGAEGEQCWSFTWFIKPVRLRYIDHVEDEDGVCMTTNRFDIRILDLCPIQVYTEIQ